jgi:hypothetical protein
MLSCSSSSIFAGADDDWYSRRAPPRDNQISWTLSQRALRATFFMGPCSLAGPQPTRATSRRCRRPTLTFFPTPSSAAPHPHSDTPLVPGHGSAPPPIRTPCSHSSFCEATLAPGLSLPTPLAALPRTAAPAAVLRRSAEPIVERYGYIYERRRGAGGA